MLFCGIDLWKSQTSWVKLPYVVGEYNRFFVFLFFFKYPQQLKLRGALHHQDKGLPGRIIWRNISCVYIWTRLFFNGKIYCGPDLLIDTICSPISASPGTRNIPLAFIPVGYGAVSVHWSIAVCWYFSGLRILIIGIIFFLFINDWYILLLSV